MHTYQSQTPSIFLLLSFPWSNIFKAWKKQVSQFKVKNQEKKNWEANQKHVGMETIGSVRLTELNVRDKLSKMRNFRCWPDVAQRRLDDINKNYNTVVKDNERRDAQRIFKHRKAFIEFNWLVNCIREATKQTNN